MSVRFVDAKVTSSEYSGTKLVQKGVIACECDTFSDLPAMLYKDDQTASFTLEMGSLAHVIETNKQYQMQSDGTWVEQIPEASNYFYTKTEIDDMVSDINDDIQSVEDDVTALQTQQGKDITMIDNLINEAGKQRINLTATTQTIDTVTLTQEADGTYTISSSGPTTQQVVFTLGTALLHTGVQYIISGISGGSNTTYFLNYTQSSATGTSNQNIYAGGYSITVGEVERTSEVKLYIRSGQEINTTISPMISEKRWYDYDPSFTTYVPTLKDLYDMVKSYHP